VSVCNCVHASSREERAEAVDPHSHTDSTNSSAVRAYVSVPIATWKEWFNERPFVKTRKERVDHVVHVTSPLYCTSRVPFRRRALLLEANGLLSWSEGGTRLETRVSSGQVKRCLQQWRRGALTKACDPPVVLMLLDEERFLPFSVLAESGDVERFAHLIAEYRRLLRRVLADLLDIGDPPLYVLASECQTLSASEFFCCSHGGKLAW
jgi:hypothetical protein